MAQPSGLCAGEPPDYLTGISQTDLDAQVAEWGPTPAWRQRLAPYPTLLTALQSEISKDQHRSVSRSFVHGYATRQPDELFMAAMAWGFGKRVQYAGHRTMLADPPVKQIATIVTAVQTKGAEAGWQAFNNSAKVEGLGWSFATKLLYFAGYTASTVGPRPLILDQFVRIALRDAGTGLCPREQVWASDYLDYLELAARWGSHPSWGVAPDVVEYALFKRGKELAGWQDERWCAFR